jgi:hypothetical protein
MDSHMLDGWLMDFYLAFWELIAKELFIMVEES